MDSLFSFPERLFQPYNMPVYPGALRVADDPVGRMANYAACIKVQYATRPITLLGSAVKRQARLSYQERSKEISWLTTYLQAAVAFTLPQPASTRQCQAKLAVKQGPLRRIANASL